MARVAWILATCALLLVTGCEAEEARRTKSSGVAPSRERAEVPTQERDPRLQDGKPASKLRLDPASDPCVNLCAARGGCFELFVQVALDPVNPALPPGPSDSCLDRCRRIRGDPLIGGLLLRQVERCLIPRLDLEPTAIECDAFLGCSLRHRLLWLKEEPWRLAALETRPLLAKVMAQTTAGDPEGAVAGCVAGSQQRDRLQRLLGETRGSTGATVPRRRDHATTTGELLLSELDRRCEEARRVALQALVQSIEAAVRDLRLEDARHSCRRLGKLRELPGDSETQAARLAEAGRACESIPPLRAVATAVSDAEADAALVMKELDRGGGGTVAYHKCVHKIATLGTLESSTHPRARAAAKVLRSACFERFPVEWLREVQRRRDPPDHALCFRVKLVTRLLQDPGAPAGPKERNQALLKWALERCP